MDHVSQNGSAAVGKGPLDAEIAVFEDMSLYEAVGIERYLREMARPDTLFADSFRFVPFVLADPRSGAERQSGAERRSGKVLTPQSCLDVTISREEARASISEATGRAERQLRRSISRAKWNRDYGGVLVASVGEGRAFQSTWYGHHGFRRMLRAAGMSEAEGFEITFHRQGKGIIVEVERAPESRGLVTALNNVIGCIHLSRQLEELQKIADMLRGKPPRDVIGG